MDHELYRADDRRPSTLSEITKIRPFASDALASLVSLCCIAWARDRGRIELPVLWEILSLGTSYLSDHPNFGL
jgi:hypothetical protein